MLGKVFLIATLTAFLSLGINGASLRAQNEGKLNVTSDKFNAIVALKLLANSTEVEEVKGKINQLVSIVENGPKNIKKMTDQILDSMKNAGQNLTNKIETFLTSFLIKLVNSTDKISNTSISNLQSLIGYIQNYIGQNQLTINPSLSIAETILQNETNKFLNIFNNGLSNLVKSNSNSLFFDAKFAASSKELERQLSNKTGEIDKILPNLLDKLIKNNNISTFEETVSTLQQAAIKEIQKNVQVLQNFLLKLLGILQILQPFGLLGGETNANANGNFNIL